MTTRLSQLRTISPDTLRKLVIGLLIAANFAILLLSIHSISNSRKAHELRAEVFTQYMAQTVDHAVTASIEKIDLAIQSVADELQREMLEGGIRPQTFNNLAERYQQRLPEVESFRVSDAKGRVILGKGVNPKEFASWADRDYFPLLRDHPNLGLHISKAQIGRIAKTQIIGFKRRYNRPDGSFVGIVAAPITLDHFNQILARFDARGKAALVIRDIDLGLIARHPAVAGPAGAPGSTIVSTKLQELTASGAQTATYNAVLAADNREWTITYRRLSAAPMIVLAGVPKDEYLAGWYDEVKKTVASVAIFLLLSLIGSWYILRQGTRMIRESTRNKLYLRHASEGVYILDSNGNLIEASDHFCKMLGYQQQEVTGMNFVQWEAGWSAEALHTQILPELLKPHSSVVFYSYYRRKDGVELEVEVQAASFMIEESRFLFVASRDMGERKKYKQALVESESRLRQSEERYRLFLQNSPLGVLHYDTRLVVTFANDRFAEIMQVPKGHMIGLACTSLHDQSVVPPMRQALVGEVTHYEGVYVTSFGNVPLWISMHCGPVRDVKGNIMGGVVLLEDITARKRIEEEQRRQHEELAMAASVFMHAHEGIIICDANQVILDVNPTFSEITGFERVEIIGKTPRFLSSGRQPAEFYKTMWGAIREHGHWQGEVWNRRKDGTAYAERLTISSVCNEKNEVTHYIGTFSDISQLKRHQAELEQMAHYDALTRLPNRALLSDRMEQALARAKRNRSLVAVCYLDLDGFKAINDELGHKAGDAVLIEVGRRLKDMLRASDTVARLGGDEFVLLLNEVDGRAECEQVATRVLRAIGAPIRYEDQERSVSGSIGIALYPEAGTDADNLLRHSDQAMYTAKESGKNRHVFFDPSAKSNVVHQELVEARLHNALEACELQLYYQPIVDMHDGRIIRFEGLLRWLHPQRGLLLPSDFLHIVESTSLEINIGRWVLNEGIGQLVRWRRLGITAGLSLNISAAYLLSSGFCDELAALLARSREIEPRALEIEILESAAMANTEDIIVVFQKCRELGVTIALDDFGSGNSSLSFFRRMPVDTVKIDQVFVQSVLGSNEDLTIIESVVRLTKAFNRNLIAEGVESIEIGMLLLNLGCRVAQGFSIARPMPAEAIPAWMANYKPDHNWSLPMSLVPREDIPLFLAELDHRKWVRDLEAWVNESSDAHAPPPLSHSECRFGKWFMGPGRQRFSHLDAYRSIETIHEAVHHLGSELVELCASARCDEAQRRFPEMLALRDELVENLTSLQGAVILEKSN